jgi:GTPase SAR1 family protein
MTCVPGAPIGSPTAFWSFSISLTLTQSIGRAWIQGLGEAVPAHVEIVLVGNKSDEPGRTVTVEQGEAMASELGVAYREMSAKTGENVDPQVMDLATRIILNKDRIIGNPSSHSEPHVQAVNGTDQKAGGYCWG